MKNVQLVRLDPALEDTFANDPEFMQALVNDRWSRVAELVHGRIGLTLRVEPVSVDTLQWGGYFVIDDQTREVVGSCAFKAPPTNEGTVEIAYFTYPEFEGIGYATAMARKLVALANDSPSVRTIIAHTLPETSASTRVLEKVGMTYVGEVIDPEDGRVWLWELRTK